jgi:hypothetical protein
MAKSDSLIAFFINPFSAKIIDDARRISIVVYVALAIMVADTIMNQNANVREYLKASSVDIGLFVIFASLSIVTQYYISEYIRHKSHEMRKKVLSLDVSLKTAMIIQYLLISILLFVIVDIVANWRYLTVSLTIVTTLAYGLNICLMGLFAKIFFSWYKTNRNSIVVLLYALSFAVVVLTSFVFMTGNLYRLPEKPEYIYPDTEVSLAKSEPGSMLYIFGKIYHYSDIVSFGLKWIATAFLLYHYSQKMGRTKYWILISLPFLYFLGTYLDDFSIFKPHSENEEFYWHLYVTLNSTGGGILFYIGFLVATKHFHNEWPIKNYMVICGFGFLLFFSATQSTLGNSLYPPFGFATVSFYGLSTLLILLGLYSSAISVSEDIELRKSIKKSTLREARFLESMGTAHMEKELMKRMVVKAKEEQKELIQEAGGVKSSLSEEDILNIVKETEKDAKERK